MKSWYAVIAASFVCSAVAQCDIRCYCAAGKGALLAAERAQIEAVVSRIEALDRDGGVGRFCSGAASLQLAQQLVQVIGLKVSAPELARTIQQGATRFVDETRGNRFRIKQIILFDKAVARAGPIHNDFRGVLQYNREKDLVAIKDSDTQWVILNDSSASPELDRRTFRETLRDHEARFLVRTQRLRADQAFKFFLGIANDHLVPAVTEDQTASAKVMVALAAAVFSEGQFYGTEAYRNWLSSAQSIAYGGADALNKRFAVWLQDPTERRRALQWLALR